MLSKEIEKKLVELFITISTGEEKINKLKQNILTNFNINPIQLFFKLDINKSGYLTKNDICSYFKYFSINFIPTDIEYLFYFYDKDNDGCLNFYEFLNLIISDSSYLYKKTFKKKYRRNKIEPNEINGEIDINIEKSIIEIFIKEIQLSRVLNELILKLKQNNNFMIQDVFYEIKSYSYITNDSIKAFFDRNEISYNDKFIKNIFNRFDSKETNGKISFNKFRAFFDLPYNISKRIKNNQISENINTIPQTMSQTYVSGDIRLTNLDTNLCCSNINQSNQKNNKYEQNYININNENYINEEDIQFECSHLSKSGSIEFKNDQEENKNFKYINRNNNNSRNNLYKNYLREKRSKSLEKSLSRSLSKSSEGISRIDKKKYDEKNIKKIRNIRPIYEDNYDNNFMNDANNFSNSEGSIHEDIQIKLPVRLDKNLVQRKLPKRKNNNNINKNNKKMMYNFNYDNQIEDLNMNNNTTYNSESEQYYPQNHHHHSQHYHKNNSDYKNNQNMLKYGNENEKTYDDKRHYQGGKYGNDGINPKNFNLKIYQEDISTKIDNGRY